MNVRRTESVRTPESGPGVFALDFVATVRSKSAVFVADLNAIGRADSERTLRRAIDLLDERTATIAEMRDVLVSRLVQIGAENPSQLRERALDIIANVVYASYGMQRPREGERRKRTRQEVRPRHVTLYLARKLTTYSLGTIALHFECNHTTVLNACDRITPLAASLDATGLCTSVIEALELAVDHVHVQPTRPQGVSKT